MERIPLHSWEMEFSIQYHVTINSQLNNQNSIRYVLYNIYSYAPREAGQGGRISHLIEIFCQIPYSRDSSDGQIYSMLPWGKHIFVLCD
jgi:hypothetical protein